MADIKDKNVTVEALSALHEHNKETYMTQNNPTGSGSLSINRKADTTIGDNSVAIGWDNTASASSSHAQNYKTVASGVMSHAEGNNTIAAGMYQHAQGKFNIEDTSSKYAHIVGNGDSSSTRSNAHTIDWDGNGWFKGDIYVGGENQDEGTRLVKSENVASIEYGDTLPTAGNVGRVFFKKVNG